MKLPAPIDHGISPEALAQLIADANKVAEHAHRNQTRRFNGDPYIVHPIAVADLLPPILKPIGLLHDVLEDNPSDYPEARLRELFPAWVVDRIVLLTRLPGVEYDEYVLNLSRDMGSKLVKIADLRDNLKDLQPGHQRDKYRFVLRNLGEQP